MSTQTITRCVRPGSLRRALEILENEAAFACLAVETVVNAQAQPGLKVYPLQKQSNRGHHGRDDGEDPKHVDVRDQRRLVRNGLADNSECLPLGTASEAPRPRRGLQRASSLAAHPRPRERRLLIVARTILRPGRLLGRRAFDAFYGTPVPRSMTAA